MSLRGSFRNRYDSAVETLQTFRRRVIALNQMTQQNPGLWPELDAQMSVIQASTQALVDALQLLNASKPARD
jgi:hypothetical protein